MTQPGAKTVRRALSLLKAFTDQNSTWTLTGLAAHTGLSKATTHRLLSALEAEGFVARERTGGEYRLGPEIIALGALALRSVDLREMARGELERLAEVTGETTSLEILLEGDVLILDEVLGRGLLGVRSSIGTRWPAYATATGKVLLAFSPPGQAVTPLRFDRFTDNTIRSSEELSLALEEVRRKGHATNLEELEPGFAAVASPIFDREGRATAAMSIGGPVHRIRDQKVPELAALLAEATEAVSVRLGFGKPH